jgi:P-type E1-E2 ATPase
MIQITIPGFGNLQIEHLVMDFNGTIAQDGRLLPGVRDHLQALAKDLQLHVITADTFGHVRSELEGMPCSMCVLDQDRQPEGKQDFVRRIGRHRVAAIGNGRNDRLMLRQAALAIAVILAEGAHSQVLLEADVVCTRISDALALLRHPLRLTATLRS